MNKTFPALIVRHHLQLRIQRANLEESLEEGLEESLEEGLEESLEEGLEESLEEGLEESLEEGLEESQESNLEESLEENLAENREEVTGDSVGIQSEAETLEETAPDCSLFNSGKSPEKLRNDAEDAVSKIVSSLKGHPLFEGDVLSHNLSTAALIISFSTGSKPESDNTQTYSKRVAVKVPERF